ncbi:MAG TPA: RdgB/HAM1 family non-canonical purine NTP pyrophosphatase [Actinomycetota bacterium]|nr:RdgB/HAM1 family non-canonical purine NTP pyrophosphatase [Actinomycetota bacterium]
MAFPPRIAIASRNAHKLREIRRICADWPVAWLTVDDHEGVWPDVEETGSTYLENAQLKARAGAAALGEASLADDSGIEVDALGGRPGPRSARFAGEDASDDRNLQELIRALKGVPSPGRTARYRCVAVLAFPDGRELSVEGVCEGVLEAKPRGTRGFGYDPIFVPAGLDRTMAELTDEEKDRISHRGRALRALREAVQVV